jgi:hypothetical protein
LRRENFRGRLVFMETIVLGAGFGSFSAIPHHG